MKAPYINFHLGRYFCNMRPVVGLIDVLYDKKIKKRIVLDTVDGIVICSQLKFSNVILQALNNHSTARIVGHDGKFIGKWEWPVGNNVLYFIELITHDGMESFSQFILIKRKLILMAYCRLTMIFYGLIKEKIMSKM